MFEYSGIPQISDLRKCRLCFDNQTSLIHIFQTTGSVNEVASTISEVLNFEVSAEDHFPPFVCLCCSSKLFDFRAFKAKCYSLRETYKLILQNETESVRKVDGGMPVAENTESNVFLERNVAEPNHEEVSPYNVSPLPMKAEDAAVGDGIGVSEQIETEQEPKVSLYNEESLPQVEHTVNDDRIGVSEPVEREQKSKDSAFNVAELPIKTELIEDEDEVEMIEEAEMSEEAENDQIPEDSAFDVAELVEDEMFEEAEISEEAENDPIPDNVASDPLEGIGNDTEVFIKNEMDIDEWVMPQDMLPKEDILEREKSEAGEEVLKDTEVSSEDFIQNDEQRQDEIQPEEDTSKVSAGIDFKHNYAAKNRQTEELEELQSSESLDINSSECLGQMNENFETVSSINNSSVVSTSGISGKSKANKKMCEESVKNDLFTDKESFLSLKSKSGDNSAKSGSSSSEKAVQSKRKQFVCDVCKKSFFRKCHLSRHVKVHCDDRPFKCRECGKSFKHEFTKNLHELAHLKKQMENEVNKKRITKKSHVCEICKKELSSRRSLQMHSYLHKNKYLCTFCGKRCASKYHLDKHSRIHTNEKPFSCEVCKRTFNLKGNLKSHQVTTHSDNRSFPCSVCDKRFKTNHHRNRHELYHLRSK